MHFISFGYSYIFRLGRDLQPPPFAATGELVLIPPEQYRENDKDVELLSFCDTLQPEIKSEVENEQETQLESRLETHSEIQFVESKPEAESE